MVTSEIINDATQTRVIPEKRYYCTKPFEQIQLLENGNMIPCCPPWINHYTIGNINEGSYEEIWNGEKAQEFRKSILDGSFRYCNEKSCLVLFGGEFFLYHRVCMNFLVNDYLVHI